jgi:membrane protease YdiL (CAAX protease family)
MIVVPWMLTFYVACAGRTGRAQRSDGLTKVRYATLGTLLGRKWDSFGRAGVDIVIGVTLAIAIRLLEHVLVAPVDAAHASAVAAMLPRTGAERAVWIVVAMSTGFGEEVVYRGYLQRQLGALTRHPIAGVLLQAVLFGVAHLQQGPAAAARVVDYGLLLGGVVRARNSLWPAIIAHVLIDASGAFV